MAIAIGIIIVVGIYTLLASMAIVAACSDATIQQIMAERRK